MSYFAFACCLYCLFCKQVVHHRFCAGSVCDAIWLLSAWLLTSYCAATTRTRPQRIILELAIAGAPLISSSLSSTHRVNSSKMKYNILHIFNIMSCASNWWRREYQVLKGGNSYYLNHCSQNCTYINQL